MDELALGNSKALNALFNGVDKNIFRLINTCTVAQDAWEILKTTHEGTSKVKMSRLQRLATKFENLKMKEEECIHDFHVNILEIANACTALEEGQRCEYAERRSQVSGFDEEAIGELLCSPGHDFARSIAGKRVWIMCTSMTTLT